MRIKTKMAVFQYLFCFVALFGVCSAHLCLISPPQRGSMEGLDTPGSDDCNLTYGPCGGRPHQRPETFWKIGGNYTVYFQKNLDYGNSTSSQSGYYDVGLITDSEVIPLTSVPDEGEKSLYLYKAHGHLPLIAKGDIILQVMYVTNNPDAPPQFFQCSDVRIH